MKESIILGRVCNTAVMLGCDSYPLLVESGNMMFNYLKDFN